MLILNVLLGDSIPLVDSVRDVVSISVYESDAVISSDGVFVAFTVSVPELV